MCAATTKFLKRIWKTCFKSDGCRVLPTHASCSFRWRSGHWSWFI